MRSGLRSKLTRLAAHAPRRILSRLMPGGIEDRVGRRERDAGRVVWVSEVRPHPSCLFLSFSWYSMALRFFLCLHRVLTLLKSPKTPPVPSLLSGCGGNGAARCGQVAYMGVTDWARIPIPFGVLFSFLVNSTPDLGVDWGRRAVLGKFRGVEKPGVEKPRGVTRRQRPIACNLELVSFSSNREPFIPRV